MRWFLAMSCLCLMLAGSQLMYAQQAKVVQISIKDGAIAGDDVTLVVSGLQPNARVTIIAEMLGRSGRKWRSTADFTATEKGIIDASKQAPLTGTYSGIDPTGLFWSMNDTKEISKETALFETDEVSIVTFRVVSGENTLAEKEHRRWLKKPDVKATEVRDKGLVATFYEPSTKTPRPAILLVGGSSGGIRWQQQIGSILSSHGYATLALAYFGMPGLPENLEKIPLEYFQTAIEWMMEQSSIDKSRLAIIGVSKGGELALLLGSRFPQIKAVVAYVPGSVVFQSIGAKFENTSSWTWKGEALSFVPYGTSAKYQQTKWLVDLYEASLENREAVSKSVIEVEKIKGPVLLLSGRDDAVWPSTQMSEQIIERLKQKQFPYFYKHVAYENAGHSISLPGYTETTDTLRNGGTAAGNAQARAQGWKEMLNFLATKFRR